MDIEELSKSQIVLLTLLVSFVTSIATGIVTVTLLDQAPPAVTQNVNRIVERTVERVVPAEDKDEAVVTTEKTVVVKETDLITESISANMQSLVRITHLGGGEDGSDVMIGLGIFISQEGVVATDSALIASGESYTVTTEAGTTFETVIQDAGDDKPTALLSVVIEAGEVRAFRPVTFSSDLGVLKLGQQVIALSGSNRTHVALGIISALETRQEGEGEGEGEVVATLLDQIQTDIGEERLLLGSPLINIFGEVVGMHTTASQTLGVTAGFAPISGVIPQAENVIETAE